MPYSGLKVPKFWQPIKGQDLLTIGDILPGGVETVFLMIASYRDFQCRETIASAFTKADHPERLFVGGSSSCFIYIILHYITLFTNDSHYLY
jgi:hypothetical protein